MSDNNSDNNITLKCRHCGTVNTKSSDDLTQNLIEQKCKNCLKNLFIDVNDRFIDMSQTAYEHPLDREALMALRSLPGIDDILRQILKEFSDRYFKVFFMQNYIRVNEAHVKKLYKKLERICEIMDIDYVPELYIIQNPYPQSFVVGVDKAFIGISTHTLNILNDAEIDGVLAHEVAHIKSNHILYKTAARIMTSVVDVIASQTLGIGNLITMPLLYALKYWDRCSELSSDRAELLVTRDYDMFVRTHMKLQSGLNKYESEFDIREFEKQAEEVYSMEKENFMDKMMMIFQGLNQSHPYPVWRVGSVKEWLGQQEIYEILQGRYPKVTDSPEDKDTFVNETETTTEDTPPQDPIKEGFDKFVKDFRDFFGIK